MRNYYSYTIILFCLLFFSVSAAKAQMEDTIRILQYNFVTPAHNVIENSSSSKSNIKNIEQGDKCVQSVVDYARPDIFVVSLPRDKMQQREFFTCQDNYYTQAEIPGDSPKNKLFYNSDKLELKKQESVATESDCGEINLYKLFYRGRMFNLRDTSFVNCFVVNLHDGVGEDGEYKREMATRALLEYCDQNYINGSVLVMGDVNINSNDEPAYQNMVNNSFVVPKKSQDRFDAGENIFINETFNEGSIRYIPGSFETISIYRDENLKSLFSSGYDNKLDQNREDMPVIMQLMVSGAGKRDVFMKHQEPQVWFNNPFHDQLRLRINWGHDANLRMDILSIIGKVVCHREFRGVSGNCEWSIPVSSLENGMYLLKISDNNHKCVVKKLLKY